MIPQQRLAEDLLLLRQKASQYALYGVLIASTSVIIATLLVSYVMADAITLESIILAQTSNIALWTVDGMPFLFAIWGQYASYRMAREANELIQHKTQSLREALTQANFTSMAKSDFFAKMSHELRTPINGIIGMSDLLIESKLSDEQRRHSEIIKSSASGLLTLINDLLDFSKIESGKLELEEIEFDLRECIEKSVALLGQQAQIKGLTLTNPIQPDMPNRLLGDPGRLRQIIINLIGNAIKFTHTGEIVLSVKKLPEESSERLRLQIEVADTGIGISAKDLTKLFQPYNQAKASTTRRYGGTGLGLAITKELVEAMDGQIGVKSEEGKGSLFWFILNLRKPAVAGIAPAPAPAQIDLKRLRVLVADGNIPARVNLVDQLKTLGMEVQSIGNGNAALQMIRSAADSRFRFDLVMMDMYLPNLSGEDLGREIKSNPEMRNTVIAMMTSAGARGDAQRLNQIGFAGYFGKPIPSEDLLDMLKAVMVTRGMDELERQRSGLVTKYTLAEIRKQNLRLLLVEDSAVNREIMLKTLSKLGYAADTVESGHAAVAAARGQSYGLILMDLHLPDISGVQAIEAIRALPDSHANVPIIVLTAGATDTEKERCRSLGVKEFLTKPVEHGLLADALNRRQTSYPAAAVAAAAPAPVSTEQASEDEAFNTDPKLVEIFIKEATQRLSSLRQALTSSDAQRAAREAHTLKSSSAYFQAHAMHDAAEKIEKMADNGQLGKVEPVLQALERAYAGLCARLKQGTI